VAPKTIVSHAQNGEDVVLWRALGHLSVGVYVDVGGYDPDVHSVTRLFYDHGWRGVTVEPVPDFAQGFRDQRPEDETVEAAVTDQHVDEVVLHRFGSTGLSTLDDRIAVRHDHDGRDQTDLRVRALSLDEILERSSLVHDEIHFLKIDVEGAEAQVLRSVDLTRWRPWVVLVEATEPLSAGASHSEWEPLVLSAGYEFTLFDGLSRWYVSPDHPELTPALSYPACALDDYIPAYRVELERQVSELTGALRRSESQAGEAAIHWHNLAVAYWAESVASAQTLDDITRQAKLDTEHFKIQLQQLRKKVQMARKQRDRLRTKAERMGNRMERMEARIRRMRARIDTLQSNQARPNRSALGRLRDAVRGRPDG
jgi:FkbM family methyltransferase